VVFLSKDSLSDKIGVYRWGGSLGGTALVLDSAMHFQKRDCVDVGGGIKLDAGTWFISRSGGVALQVESGIQHYAIMKYRHYYFCIPFDKRSNFVHAFRKAKLLFKKITTIHVGESVYTGNDMAAFSLMKSYYFRDVNDL
jgi:hypothetical protein